MAYHDYDSRRRNQPRKPRHPSYQSSPNQDAIGLHGRRPLSAMSRPSPRFYEPGELLGAITESDMDDDQISLDFSNSTSSTPSRSGTQNDHIPQLNSTPVAPVSTRTQFDNLFTMLKDQKTIIADVVKNQKEMMVCKIVN